MFRRMFTKMSAFGIMLALVLTSVFPQVFASFQPVTKAAAAADPYEQRFMELWEDLHNPDNGYTSPEGIPYHSIETLVVT